MLHRIKELFQKTSCQKTGKTGENKSNSRGQITAENGTQERIQQNQHGRTMTEMLGVLAIMGVLSIGALAGYRYAMDKHRANATMNDINLRGVDLVIQASRNIDLNLDEWSNTSTAGYTFGTPEYVADGFVKLPISGLPERVCEMVVDGLSGQYDMDINGVRIDENATCGDDNTITVFFDATGPAGTDDGCGGCPGARTCVDGACVCTNGGTGEDCEKDLCEGVSCGDCATCQNGSCVTKADYESCSSGYCERGICISNENPETGGSCTTSEDCGNSCMYCADGLCLSKKEGTACGENGTCRLLDCVYPCSEEYPLKDSNGDCHSCDTRAAISVWNVKGNCSVCPNRVLGGDSNNYCIRSEGCPTDRPLRDGAGNCYSCTTTIGVFVYGVESNCAVCDNRVLQGYNNDSCVLSECPADKPLKDYYGNCHSCTTTSGVYVSGVTGNCDVCGNRVLNGDYCVLSECPADKPLMASNGDCHSCTTASSIDVYGVTGNCSVCKDRVLNGRYCALPCPSDKPLMDYYGNCYSCDYQYSVYVYGVTGNCSVCKDRVLSGDKKYCVLPCPTDKPLVASNGTCYSCNTPSRVNVSGVTGNCAVCGNRKLNGSSCVLK